MSAELSLAGLALICLALGFWLGVRSMRYSDGPATARRRRTQGFVGAFLILIPYLGLSVWLHETVVGWPEAYGSTCQGRRCLIENMSVSPELLGGGWRENALFAQLWSLPAFVVGTLAYLFISRRGIFAKNQSE
jgi:hypothetical protein